MLWNPARLDPQTRVDVPAPLTQPPRCPRTESSYPRDAVHDPLGYGFSQPVVTT